LPLSLPFFIALLLDFLQTLRNLLFFFFLLLLFGVDLVLELLKPFLVIT